VTRCGCREEPDVPLPWPPAIAGPERPSEPLSGQHQNVLQHLTGRNGLTVKNSSLNE
jgi:hypothetical protein